MSAGAKQILKLYTAKNAISYINTLKGVEFENYLLDFKMMSTDSNGCLSKSDRTNFSEAISGFANSEGGVIVWGVECRPIKSDGRDVVQELHPIKQLKEIFYDLRRIEPDMSDPALEGIEHHMIETSQGSNEGFIATYIPKAESFPIMAMGPGTQRCYYRSSHSFQFMRHRMLADRFAKGQQPRLDLDWIRLQDSKLFWIVIKNTGQTIAREVTFILDTRDLDGFPQMDLKVSEKRGFTSRFRNSAWIGTSNSGIRIPQMDYVEIVSFRMPDEPFDLSIRYQVSCDGDFKSSVLRVTSDAIKIGRMEEDFVYLEWDK